MSIAKDRSSCRKTISRALTTGMLGLALVFGVAVSQSHAQLYGNGADGSHTVVGTEHLTGHMNYVDLTVPPGAILETHGYEIRVTGFLINQGTITDSYSGGAGGPGGPGGDPTTGTGQNGTPGGTGVAGPSGAGTGGNGGGGGGAGGSARDFDDNKLALGGSGGDGGMGGKGGGRVRIFARHFNNLGVIHADGFSGQNGSPGQTGQYVTYTESVFFTRDLAGGGGGAGAGGHGGNGGTVTIVYETPTNFGTLSVQGGPPGGNSFGGNPINTNFGSGSSVQEYPGGLGATFDANGGDGGQGEVADLNSGSGGGSQPGAVGAPGVITLSQSNKCFPDADGDGYGNIASAGVDVVGACGPGTSLNNYDCDDTQPTVNPAAPDIPDDGIDQDCDGVEAVTCYKDADNDGFGSPVGWVVTEGPCSSGYVSVGGDCDDGNNSIYPGATEIPNDGIDQDCDGFDAQLCYEDADGDGYGDPGSSMVSSGPCLVGWVVDNTDNCPFNFNPGQEDNNTDGVGNACCCVGVTGNVNGIGIVDLADLSLLVGYLTVPFPGKPVLPCPAEANVNAAGIIDLADLSMLVAYLTVPAPGKPALPNCP